MSETTPAARIHAAGGVVYRSHKGSTEFLVAFRPGYNDWSIPKGKLDPGEKFRDCAIREVREETGFSVAVGPFLGGVLYKTQNQNSKLVRYWLMQATTGSFEANDEVAEIAWLPKKKVLKRLSYTRDRALVETAARHIKDPTAGTVYLVRHAHAGVRDTWKGPDLKRPLSLRGYKQVSAIENWLAKQPVSRVASSKLKRCRQTVGGYADEVGLPLERETELTEGSSGDDLARFITLMVGEQAAVCSHGDIIGAYIGKLVAEGVIDGPLEWRKGSVWTVHTRSGVAIDAEYRAPENL
ncbi:MAG: NUDIX hydrolase [Actinobacteria bacterium]|nr:NUDIX hydrolase [Actinomycetota bacterium]